MLKTIVISALICAYTYFMIGLLFKNNLFISKFKLKTLGILVEIESKEKSTPSDKD